MVLALVRSLKGSFSREGLYNSTLKKILRATELNDRTVDFWLIEKDGDVLAYVLAQVSEGVDDRLCYWVEQGYVDPSIRGKFFKENYKILEERAKELFCSHIINNVSHSPESFTRLFGDGYEEYTHLIKKDLGG